MKRLVLPGLLLLATISLPVAGSAAQAPDDGAKPAKPTLRLKTSAYHGIAPLKVTLTGDIIGGEPAAVNTCLLSEEWTGDTPVSGLAPNTKRTIPCVTVLDDGNVPRSFQREVTLSEPGVYSYRILLTPKEGRRIASQSIEVRAVRSRFEVKSTAGGGAAPIN
jgi:hypothetical protein